MCLPQILFPMFMLCFHCSHFHLAGRQHFSFFSPPLWNFHVFSSNEIRRLGVHSLALALSLLSTWVYTSKITSKKTRLFFFSKSPGHSKLNLELHLGYHTCWLSYFFIVGVPVVQTDGRSGGRTVTWLPKFLGCIGYQIFSPMVLRARESSAISIRKFMAQNEDSMMCHPHADQQAMLWLNNILNKTHFYDTRLLHQPPASIVLHLSVILNYIYWCVHGAYDKTMRSLR